MAILAITVVGCRSEDSVARVAGGLPRYALERGQELHYAGQGDFKYDGGSFESASDWKIWVTRENSDGSRRLVIRQASVHGSKNVTSDDADVSLAYLDLHPDGRFTENSSFGYRFDPHSLFAHLPADENELRSGWDLWVADSDTTFRHTAKTSDLTPTADWEFSRVEDSPRNQVYQLTRETQFAFARGQGLIRRADTSSKQEKGNGSGVDHIELQDVARREPAWIAALDRDLEHYLEVSDRYSKLLKRLEVTIEQAADRLNQAGDLLTKLRAEVTSEVVRDAIDRRIAQHETWNKHRLEEAEKKARVLGQPAPDWDGTDLAGNRHRLADYAGKVVVLDFWYRGCGWCIRAMPQVNQLAADFAAAPVAVLGMNRDSKLEDAQFVENVMQLKYPSVRIDKELPQKYGVSGFPTLVILDQMGTIRDMHVGYTPTLRDDVSKTVAQLLEAKQ
ncbi:MAG: TlpA disulfide reductase family protein [Pirellulales bacterium]